jgi:tetratricopeptide (TPR) repeat protein
MDPQSKPTPPSPKLLWVLWLTFIALFVGFHFLRTGPLAAQAPVFRQAGQGWKALPPLGSLGYHLRISGGGVAWVQTRNGQSRLDGAAWHAFTASDFGTEYGYLPGGFALDGEEVWGAATDGVVHFDGQRWRRYPESLATDTVTSIAAAHGQVWAIDTQGHLSHFDGRAWAIRKLDLPGVQWGARRGHEPKLAATANGALWLVFQGLWRYDGSSWTRIPGVGSEAMFLGTNEPGSYLYDGKKVKVGAGVWVLDAGKVTAFNAKGAPGVPYTMHALGLEDSAQVYAVAGRPPVLVVASSQGLVWFEGSQWHGGQLKALGVTTASSVDVAPDPSHPQNALHLYSYLAVGILLLFVIAVPYTAWWIWRKARYQRTAARQALLHATGALPEDLQGSAFPAGKVAGLAAVAAIGGGGYWLVKRHWPDAPSWLLPAGLLPALFLAFHIGGTVMESLKKRKPLPSDPIVPGGPPRYDWAKSIAPLLGGLALVVLLYGGVIARHFHIRWLAAVPGLALVLGGQLLFHAYDAFRSHRVEREIKRCRYGGALEILDGPLRWPSTGLWKLMRVDVLFLFGRVREAEPILRELVESGRGSADRTLAFEKLGRVLLAQSRYSDARRAFEAAATISPTRSAAPCGLAEVRLLEGTDPAQALADAERALELYRHSLVERKGARERVATIRGNQAWALGLLGRGADAQQAIEAGPREMDMKYAPEVAGFYWRAGMAMLALGNLTAAAGHFRRAVELDPQGYYGGLAAQHLRQHSVWGA